MSFCIWICGKSSTGKTTVADALAKRLRAQVPKGVEHIDGEFYRAGLNRDLGYSKRDRDESCHRVSFVASVLVKHDVIAIVSAASPHVEARRLARERFACGRFTEVELYAERSTLLERDISTGERFYSRGFVSLDDRHESNPESLALSTDTHDVQGCVDLIFDQLEDLNLVEPSNG